MTGTPRKITVRAACMAVLALILLAAGRAEAVTLPADFQDSLVANANQPTSLAFVPGGRLLIAEEAGVVRVYKNGALNATPALDIHTRVCSDGERGLMAVAVDPQFESNHFIYAYYTWVKNGCVFDDPNTPVNRVSRFVLRDDDTVDATAETVLIDNIPAPQSYHIGADLQFGKDGLLYVSTGDGGCDYAGDSGCLELNDAARDRHVLLAKILRITRTGAIPAGNPWQGTGTARCNVTGRTTSGTRCQETFAWGLRNPFRLAIDPNSPTTRLFINDVGEITWEEIDLGQAGADYGWNVREGFCATGSTTNCGAPPAGMTNPVHAYSHEPSGCYAITGGAFVPKGIWPVSYDDDYLYADLVCGRVFRMSPKRRRRLGRVGMGDRDREPDHDDVRSHGRRDLPVLRDMGRQRSPGAAHYLHGSRPGRVPAPEGRLTATRTAGAGVCRLYGREPDARAAARAPVLQSDGADLTAADGRYPGRQRCSVELRGFGAACRAAR